MEYLVRLFSLTAKRLLRVNPIETLGVKRAILTKLLWFMLQTPILKGLVTKYEIVEVVPRYEGQDQAKSDGTISQDSPMVWTQKVGPGEKDVRVNKRPGHPIRYLVFNRASVSIPNRVSGISLKNLLIISQPGGPGPWKIYRGHETSVQGGILGQNDNRVLVRKDPSLTLDKGIFVGSWNCANWYLWLSTVLPTVYLVTKLPERFHDYPLILPKSIENKPNWQESLHLVIGERPVLYVGDNTRVTFRELVWIDAPLDRGPYSIEMPFEQKWQAINYSIFREFSREIASGIATPGKSIKVRKNAIYIYRQPTLARPYNQDELINVTKSFGVTIVDFSEMGFAETVNLMRGVDLILGAHGAGWTNMMFTTPGTHGIYWTELDSIENNNFTNLATVFDVRLRVLRMAKSDHGWRLNPRLLEEELQHYFSS